MRQRVDVADGRIRPTHLFGHVVGVDMTLGGEVNEHGADEFGVLCRGDAAIIRQGAGVPQHGDALGRIRQVAYALVAREDVERLGVDRGQRARQALDRGNGVDGALQRIERGEIELGAAPLQHLHAVEIVRLDALHQFVGKRIDLAGDAERAVAQMPAGAAGDLAHLGRREFAILEAVEFAVLGEGDMVDVEVQTHADRVGGDEIVDVAGLVEQDLRIAGARRERTEDDGGAAALAPDQLGDGVDLVG